MFLDDYDDDIVDALAREFPSLTLRELMEESVEDYTGDYLWKYEIDPFNQLKPEFDRIATRMIINGECDDPNVPLRKIKLNNYDLAELIKIAKTSEYEIQFINAGNINEFGKDGYDPDGIEGENKLSDDDAIVNEITTLWHEYLTKTDLVENILFKYFLDNYSDRDCLLNFHARSPLYKDDECTIADLVKEKIFDMNLSQKKVQTFVKDELEPYLETLFSPPFDRKKYKYEYPALLMHINENSSKQDLTAVLCEYRLKKNNKTGHILDKLIDTVDIFNRETITNFFITQGLESIGSWVKDNKDVELFRHCATHCLKNNFNLNINKIFYNKIVKVFNEDSFDKLDLLDLCKRLDRSPEIVIDQLSNNLVDIFYKNKDIDFNVNGLKSTVELELQKVETEKRMLKAQVGSYISRKSKKR